MTQTRFIEYKAPVNAFPLSQKFQGILPGGRYCGFNNAVAGSGVGDIPVSIQHYFSGSFLPVDSSNNLGGVYHGAVVTKHGVTITSDTSIQVAVTINHDPSSIRKDSLYIEHSWAMLAGGSVATFGVMVGTPGLSAPTLAGSAIRTKIGEIWVAPNGSTFADITYYPDGAPSLGGQSIVDNYPELATTFARLNAVNRFTKLQEEKLNSITVDALEMVSNTLTIGDGGNLINLTITNSTAITSTNILSIIKDGDGMAEEGTTIIIHVAALPTIGSFYFQEPTDVEVDGSSDPGILVGLSGVNHLELKEKNSYVLTCISKESPNRWSLVTHGEYIYNIAAANQASIAGLTSLVNTKASLIIKNIFTKLQEFNWEQTSTIDSDNCIVITGEGNQVTFFGDGSDITVAGIKVGTEYIKPGTIITINFVSIGSGSIFSAYISAGNPGFFLPNNSDIPIAPLSTFIVQHYGYTTALPVFLAWASINSIADTQPPWQEPVPEGDWDIATLSADLRLNYRKNTQGQLELSGMVTLLSPASTYTTITRLPYAPSEWRAFVAVYWDGSALNSAFIGFDTTGDLVISVVGLGFTAGAYLEFSHVIPLR